MKAWLWVFFASDFTSFLVSSHIRLCLSTLLSNHFGRPGATWYIRTRRKSWRESRTTDTGIMRRYQNMIRRENQGNRVRQGGKNVLVGREQGRKPSINRNRKPLVSDTSQYFDQSKETWTINLANQNTMRKVLLRAGKGVDPRRVFWFSVVWFLIGLFVNPMSERAVVTTIYIQGTLDKVYTE